MIKQELNLFHDTDDQEKSKYLQALHEFLCAIPPTSVESEQCFSVTGLFAGKIRSRFGDDTLNALLFLRQHFKHERELKDK